MELIVVTAIISILFTISYTTYKGYHQRARAYSAKKDLSSIISMAEVFKANTGFYLPNLRAMHIPIQGRYSYNYKIICQKDGTTLLWETTNIGTDICGAFTPTASSSTPPQLDISTSCGSATCWAGAVLCHHYSAGTSISCGSEDYTFQFQDRGVLQWREPDGDWTDPNTILKDTIAPLFNIVDFAGKKEGTPGSGILNISHCKRVSRQDDVFADSSNCFFNKEFAVDSSNVKAIIEANWVGDEEAFISTPFKLAVTALACKEKQDDCTGTDTSLDYSIIRMDTNRLVQVVR